MNYPKLKALKYKLIIPLLVFLFGTGVLCVVIYKISYTNQERVRDKAALNAVSYADRMIADLNNGITITKSLDAPPALAIKMARTKPEDKKLPKI